MKHEQDMKLQIETNQIHNEEHSAQTILTTDKNLTSTCKRPLGREALFVSSIKKIL